jgi:hypothetical protein
VLGTAEVDVDWSTEVEPLRAELRATCESSELWDGRVCVLQVTQATGGMVRLRALVSASDAPSLWDLRCLVRERLVTFIWAHQRDALPRYRADLASGTRPVATAPRSAPRSDSDDSRFYSGEDGEERHANFAGPEEPVPVPANR